MSMSERQTSIRTRVEAIEEAYEFLLAFAAQGALDATGPAAAEVRRFLAALAAALDGLDGVARAESERLPPDLAPTVAAFAGVVGEDARRALAAVRLVAAGPRLGSQLIDNLNANIHLRAVLTDLFLLDELLRDELLRS